MKRPRVFIAIACVALAGACDASPREARAPAGAGSDPAADVDAGAAGLRLAAGDSASAADRDARQPGAGTAPSPPLIDSTIPPAIAGEDGWSYHQSASADLDGDGSAERVVLTARVEMYRGRPAWDDGQPWQVYVEPVEGARTYLYAQRLQLGTLTMRITTASHGEPPTIVLLEHLPHQLSVYEASYAAPHSVNVVTRFQRELDPRGDTASPDLP